MKETGIGNEKYDKFVKKIIGNCNIPIMTPHTSLLEKLSILKTTDREFIKLSILELAENFKE